MVATRPQSSSSVLGRRLNKKMPVKLHSILKLYYSEVTKHPDKVQREALLNALAVHFTDDMASSDLNDFRLRKWFENQRNYMQLKIESQSCPI